MRLTYNAINHSGLVRTNNEDAILVGNLILRDDSDCFSFAIPEKGVVFPAIVCDGVGGMPRGEEASMMACAHFSAFFDTLDECMSESELMMALKKEFEICNRSVLEQAKGSGMATTICGMLLLGNRALVFNAGDSRAYRLRYGNFKQLTHDHIACQENHRFITNCLGLEDAMLDISITAIVPGDVFIICSDGLFEMVPDEHIAQNAFSADRLLALSLESGGRDNISIIAMQFE